MESENYYQKLPESVKEELRKLINITDNEEFVSWVIDVPDHIKEHFKIPVKVLSEIKNSEQYQTFTQNYHQNRYGYVPETENDLAFSRSNDSATIRTKIIDKVPTKVSLCDRFNGVQDQGNVGSCVGFGVEGAMRSTIDFIFPLSPAFAYQVAKLIDGNQIEGTSLTSCIKGIERYGLCREATYPYQSDKIYKNIPARVFREAKNIRLVRYQDQKTTDYNLLEWIIGCLSGVLFDKPLAVAIGALVFKSSWITDSGKLLEPYPGEKPSSGHSVSIVGYVFDSSFPGGGYFIFRNSWGSNWARKETYCPAGYGIMSFQYAVKYIMSAVVAINLSVQVHEDNDTIPEVVKTTSAVELTPVLTSNNMNEQNKLHKIYCGITGSGKTTKLKSDILSATNKRFAVLDIHGDISGGDDSSFIRSANAKVWDIIKHGLPYNVLELMGEIDQNLSEDKIRILKTEWLIGCFKACIPDLGSRQLSMLRDEIEKQIFAYHTLNRKDLQLSGILKSIEKKRSLSGTSGRIAESLADQLRPLFKLGLLDCKHSFSLHDLLKKNQTIIFRCKVPGEMDHVLKLISVFLVAGIFSVYRFSNLGKHQSGVIVQDEFHLMPKHPVWERITREGRKFGIELWASSQNIEEMKELLANVGQRNIFRVAAGSQAQVVAKMLGWTTRHKQEIIKILSRLNNYEFFDPLDVEIK